MNKVFPTFVDDLTDETKDQLASFRKLPVTIKAMKIDTPFRVKSLEGDYAQGKEGDYLIAGIEGELYVCDANIFHKTYEAVPDE